MLAKSLGCVGRIIVVALQLLRITAVCYVNIGNIWRAACSSHLITKECGVQVHLITDVSIDSLDDIVYFLLVILSRCI